jgi:hypothetical protein
MGTDRGGHAWPRAPVREALVTLGVTLAPINTATNTSLNAIRVGDISLAIAITP